ncbi:MAG TPA: AAA family ATPase [Parafilimonas sp.]|nr:AAA family ATPase [Parafilimonas sp.]
MSFIKSFSINTTRQQPFPFNIPAVRFAKNIELDKINIFIGDNGCGKSTLLETIAYAIDLPLIGGYIKDVKDFEAARLLKSYLQLDWKRDTQVGFFFRAEDFSAFLDSVEKERTKLKMQLHDLHGHVSDAIIEQMIESQNHALIQMRKQYGKDMLGFSHGEAYLEILQTRIRSKGVYLLDEPEAALSPLKQLALIVFILETLKHNNAQFIIATHSPILMGIPGARLYEIRENEMERVEFRDTEHYRITKTFLDNPEAYLRHLQ